MNPKSLVFTLNFLLISIAGSAQLQTITYKDGSQQLNGQLIKPQKATGKKAGILILPAWMGIDAHSRRVAQQLSELGYYAFIADIYGAGQYPQTSKEAGERSSYYKKNITEYQKRIQLALEQLTKAGADPGELVVIGYCFGGAGAIEAARINLPVKGIVSFHGAYGRDASRKIEDIKPRILILHGADDPHSSAEEIRLLQEEFRQAHADWQMIYYGNAVHAFTDPASGSDNSKGAAYNEAADKRSWQAMLQFFQEIL